MIISVSISNYAIFAGKEKFSLAADMRIKRFPCNVCFGNGFNAVKAACLFGGNNSGKTCLVSAIRCIRDVLLGKPGAAPVPYRFGDSKVCSLGVEFLYEGRATAMSSAMMPVKILRKRASYMSVSRSWEEMSTAAEKRRRHSCGMNGNPCTDSTETAPLVVP